MNPVPIDALPAIAPKPVATGPVMAGGALALRRFAGRALLAVLQLLLTWQERASQRHHLSLLDVHGLSDVGLRRADLAPEIRKPFWRS
jgi:uncharacterized protein YjiS (DUF1127 family)